jgi:integration host factor subunit alpha
VVFVSWKGKERGFEQHPYPRGEGTFMTKADIVAAIYEKVGISKTESSDVVESVFEILKETLEKGEKVKISGFGTFMVKEKNSRKGRNPQTGDGITITARNVLTFKPSQVLKKAMNDGREDTQ